MLVFQSFTVKTTQTSEAISKFSVISNFLTMPIGVPNVICLCDNDKRGCNVIVVLHGSTGPVKPAFCNESTGKLLKGGDRRVRIFSAHNNWWATPEVSLPLPYQHSAKVFLNLLRQGVNTMYYFRNMHSKSLKCTK